MEQLTTADKIAAYVGGGLVVLGVVVIGLLEMLFGAKHPVSGDGQIAHDALVGLELRSSIMIAGLVVLGLVALYKVAVGPQPRR